jgi:sulfur-oxidizing protein SoxX
VYINMMTAFSRLLKILTLTTPITVFAEDPLPLPTDYCHWEIHNNAIEKALCGLEGDSIRGRELAVDTQAGNCLACHLLPIPEEPLHGTVGPPLFKLASRKTEAQIRAHVVDQRQFNPDTVMPGFYRDPRLYNRVADDHWNETLLTAQQVEDIVAYLTSLK